MSELKSCMATFKRLSLLYWLRLAEPNLRNNSRCSLEYSRSLSFNKVSSECLKPKLEPAIFKVLYSGEYKLK